jgi:hypothetical protein
VQPVPASQQVYYYKTRLHSLACSKWSLSLNHNTLPHSTLPHDQQHFTSWSLSNTELYIRVLSHKPDILPMGAKPLSHHALGKSSRILKNLLISLITYHDRYQIYYTSEQSFNVNVFPVY